MHSTDESFGRYYWVDGDDLRKVYVAAFPGNDLAMGFNGTEKAKQLILFLLRGRDDWI